MHIHTGKHNTVYTYLCANTDMCIQYYVSCVYCVYCVYCEYVVVVLATVYMIVTVCEF